MLISIKLGSALGMTNKRAFAALEQTVADIQRAKNNYVRHWERHQSGDKLKSPSYKIAREGVEHVGTTLISAAVQEVTSLLRGKLPWTDKTHKYRWQAIQNFHIARPFFRGSSISVPKRALVVAYQGNAETARHADGTHHNKAEQILSIEQSRSSATMRVQLFSTRAGRRDTWVSFRLEVAALSAGHRRILSDVVSDDSESQFLLCDSRLSCREKRGRKQWFLRLNYKPRDAAINYEGPPLTLAVAEPEARTAFVLLNDAGEIVRRLGPSKWLIRERERNEVRRQILRWRYARGAGNGHGRKRFVAKSRAAYRRWDHLLDREEKQLFSHIVDFCQRRGIYSIEYDEPSLIAGRAKSWFAKHDLEWPWSEFEARLAHKLASQRIKYRNLRKQKKKKA